jgi:conjugative relaxase-like TrwC/TraI family protein
MIRMIQSTSAGHAKTYFSDALQKADYYIDEQELKGKFLGRLSERLGLTSEATKEDFFALCENVNPVTGENLTPRTKEERTVGYDINFHCPKSVSLIHALSNDNHILDAFEKSVEDTMTDIEADSMTRVRKNGVYEDRKTGELLWSQFTHQTARPVDGSLPDPHLHAHCFTFNATWDENEQKVKACQFRDIKRDMPYYQSRFHKTLSDRLIDLGYDIKRTEKSFEISGVPKSAINHFSKRTDEIGQFAKEKGITNAKDLDGLGARSRSKKQKGYSMAELKKEWKTQLRQLADLKEESGNSKIRFSPNRSTLITNPKECMDHAISHSFERASVMGERRVLESAYRHSIGRRSTTLNAITDIFRSDSRIIHVKEHNRILCTTKEVLKEENRMVMLARKGHGSFAPLYSKEPKVTLTGQQGDAVKHLMTTKDQVSILRGVAGAGKTRTLTEVAKLIEKSGKQVILVAPSASASRGVLVDEGFSNANTVAKLLVDKEQQNLLLDQVLIVDEAGLLGTKDTVDLLRIADEQKARIIFVGDTRQHSSVQRGDALRILNKVGGIHTAELSKIRRQTDAAYREAVEHLSNGNVKKAFEKLETIGSIKVIDPLKPNEELVNDYIETIKKGKSALVVSPTHAQGQNVTKDIRHKLRHEGLIGAEEVKVKKLTNINFTEAQRNDWRNYEPEQVIRFTQNRGSFKRGSAWTVSKIEGQKVKINNQTGIEVELPDDIADCYNVYRKTEIGLSKGDKVRITRNSFDQNKKRLDNGYQAEVLAISKDGTTKLRNENGKMIYKIDKDFGDIDYAYCTTSHSSQGKTVNEVFISQPSATFTATDAKQFYVSVSRGQNIARIYTDDKENLLLSASSLGDRQSAIELTNKRFPLTDIVEQNERQKHKPNVEKDTFYNKDLEGKRAMFNDYEPEL